MGDDRSMILSPLKVCVFSKISMHYSHKNIHRSNKNKSEFLWYLLFSEILVVHIYVHYGWWSYHLEDSSTFVKDFII